MNLRLYFIITKAVFFDIKQRKEIERKRKRRESEKGKINITAFVAMITFYTSRIFP